MTLTPFFSFFLGIAGFGVSFLIHIFVWRRERPKRQLVWLAGIFLVFPAFIYVILFCLFADKQSLGLAGFLHLLFSGAYILSYPAVQAPSPSLKVIRDVQAAMPDGLRLEDIYRVLAVNESIGFCVDNLIEEKLLCFKKDKLVLSLPGRLVAGFFRHFRRCLGACLIISFLFGLVVLGAFIRKMSWPWAYLFLIYSLAAYIYFHIFNMSRSARRIQILCKIGRQGMAKEELIRSIDGEDMVLSRINRLTAWNQLEARDGRYIIKGRIFLFPAKIVFALRRILFSI